MGEPLLIWVVHQLAFAWAVPGQHGADHHLDASSTTLQEHKGGWRGGREVDVQTSKQPLRCGGRR